MTTLSVTIDDRKAAAWKEKAAHYGLALEDLPAASFENLLIQPDPDFQRSTEHVPDKKRECGIRTGPRRRRH
ncbi:MAG: hypothetical protein GY757_02605 [bacterium]|nr:hypothetical protein [bacterium]